MQQPDPDLIGSAEAARILGKSQRTVHRLVQSGDLTPAFTAPGGFAGAFLFKREDVERIVSERASA
jgi:excisionase family DNA binding protein